MANRLEVPVQTTIKLEMVPPLQRDGQHERLVLQVVLLLLVLLAAGLVLDLLVDVLGHLALGRVYAQLAVVKGKCPVTLLGIICLLRYNSDWVKGLKTIDSTWLV